MARHDAQNSGRSEFTGPQDSDEKWSFRGEGRFWGTVAIGADGTIYAMARISYFEDLVVNELYAINPDGSRRWKQRISGLARVWNASPTLGADRSVYVTSEDGNLFAFDQKGNLMWSFAMQGKSQIAAPTVGPDMSIYVATRAALYAINPDGSQRWVLDATNPKGGLASQPALGPDGSIYFGFYGQPPGDWPLYAVNPDGTVKWVRHSSGGQLSVSADGTIYVSGDDFHAINPDGSMKWTDVGVKVHRLAAPAIGSDGTVYVGSREGEPSSLRAFRPDGTLSWTLPLPAGIYLSATVDSDGTVYLGRRDGTLQAVDPDGSPRWSVDIGGEMLSSPAIDASGTLYVASDLLHAIGK